LVEIAEQIKRLEEERKEMDFELTLTYSDVEPPFAVQFESGLILKRCQRTAWIFDQQIFVATKALPREAQRRGSVITRITAHLRCLPWKQRQTPSCRWWGAVSHEPGRSPGRPGDAGCRPGRPGPLFRAAGGRKSDQGPAADALEVCDWF